MKYAKLPHRWIIHCNLQSLATAGTTAAGSEGSAAALESTIAPALAACEAALGRCLKLTTGTGLPALARAIDRAVQQYVGALQAAVASLRGSLADGGGADSSGGADVAAEGAEAVLPLLTVASQLMQRLALLEASLRQAAAEAALQLLEGGSGDGSAQVAAAKVASTPVAQLPSAAELRLQAQPALRQQLAAFAANAASGAQLLPLARAAASELERQASCAVLRCAGLLVWQLQTGQCLGALVPACNSRHLSPEAADVVPAKDLFFIVHSRFHPDKWPPAC